jgi:hypothetical protein
MTTTQLTPAQHAILAYAIEHTGGKIDWFPDNIKGGARKKVLDGLFNRALITSDGTHWFVAAEGYDALGRARPSSRASDRRLRTRRSRDGAEATWAQAADQPKPRTRENSKQAEVIRMLQRPEGRNHRPDLHRHRLAGAHGARHLRPLGFSIEQRVTTGVATINPKEPEMTTTNQIPATQNEAWGFWGTMNEHAAPHGPWR